MNHISFHDKILISLEFDLHTNSVKISYFEDSENQKDIYTIVFSNISDLNIEMMQTNDLWESEIYSHTIKCMENKFYCEFIFLLGTAKPSSTLSFFCDNYKVNDELITP